MLLLRCISILCLVGTASCIFDSTLPSGLFYPFGTDQGDAIITPSDDGSSGPQALSIDVLFFDRTYNNLYVMMNGLITFDREINDYTPVALSTLDASYLMIAPYWADIITSANGVYGPGRVYYRQLTNNFCLQPGTLESHTNNPSLLAATYDVRSHFDYLGYSTFEACWMLIATWHNVTFYGGSRTSPTNTFQAVLIADWENSFAMFNYGKLQWTCGTDSGCNLSGLGGRAALVGYKSCCNYKAVGWSLTDQVLFMVNTSNVRKPGRWAWQIGHLSNNGCHPAVIATGGQCKLVYQNNSAGNGCQDIAPSFTCPTLSGPTVINRLWVEFYCTINTDVTDPAARFEVTFLFDGASANDVPVFTATVDNPRVTLHEMYLYGKLNKRLSCQVVSYWSSTSNKRSRALLSFSPSYYLGIQATNYDIDVAESDLNPKTVLLQSTIPVTCLSESLAALSTPCSLSLNIVAGAESKGITDVAVRQRYPGLDPTANSCGYIIRDNDWKANEKLAYNNDGKLEIIARIDPFITGPRATQLVISFPAVMNKTVNSKTYINPWSGYVIEKNLLVYHYDSHDAVSTCSSTGDPHLTTFDGLFYSTYGTGTFIYAQSQSGLPLEVQVRHKPCNPGAPVPVTCICGIALREDNIILSIDVCDGDFHTISWNGKNLPPASGIFTDRSTHRYKLQVPSGTRVYGDVYPGFMNMYLTVVGKRQLQGLCGSPNGNLADDLTIRGTNQIVPIAQLIPGFAGPQLPETVAYSWSVPPGSTLFDNKTSSLPRGNPAAESVLTYCHCSATSTTCGGPAVSLPMFPNDPDRHVPPAQPINNKPFGRRRKRADENYGALIFAGDYIDSTYDPMNFPPTSVNILSPAISSGTTSVANATCWSKVMDATYLGPSCKASIRPSDAQGIVNKCIKDIVLTNNTKWADDKIAEVQKTCYFDQITKNNSDINDTASAIQKALNDVQLIISFTCSPFDCSGHGKCSNGVCNCSTGYIGKDCGVLRTAVPSVDRVIDPTDCDVASRPCQTASLKTTNAASVDSLTCRIRVLYLNGTTETYVQSARLTSLSSVMCSLPNGPLQYMDSTFNFSSKYSSGTNFNCVSPGSPVITYSISVSNDGTSFGNEKTIRLINKSCYNCNSSGCAQLPNTCLINGYCFKDQDRNPLQNSCSWCRPSQSSTSWTSIQGSYMTSCMTSISCTTTTTTSTTTATTKPTTTTITPSQTSTTTTVTTTKPSTTASTTTSTSTSTAKTTSSTTTTTTTPSQTSTTTTVTTTATLLSTTLPTNRCGSWRVFENQHSFGGNRQPDINNLNDCLTRCVNDVSCSAVDYSFQASADSRCWHFNAQTGYQGARYSMGGTNQYVLTIDSCSCNSSSSSQTSTQSTPRCNSTAWQVYANQHSFYGDRQSDITNLNDCLTRCLGTNQCDAVDFDTLESPGSQCWFHSNVNGFSSSRSPLTGTHQYVISPNWCSCNATPNNATSTTTTIKTTTTTTTTAPCVEVWAEYIDQNSFYGVSQPGASDLVACKRSCINDIRCLAIDFTPGDSPDLRCWLHLDADFAETRGSWSGTTQYVLQRSCN